MLCRFYFAFDPASKLLLNRRCKMTTILRSSQPPVHISNSRPDHPTQRTLPLPCNEPSFTMRTLLRVSQHGMGCPLVIMRRARVGFKSFEFVPDAQPSASLPPNEWAGMEGRARVERCRLKASLVLHAEVRNFPKLLSAACISSSYRVACGLSLALCF